MANDERKAQLSFAVDASGVKQGLADIKRDVREMTQDVAKSGKEAAKGLGSIGDGGPAAQQKVDGAAKSIINSIQRTTAAMDAGEKGSARYFEVLGKQRGVSADLLEPYLQQLRRAEGAQKLATGSLGSMEMSAKATAAALRGVPAQFTDIVVSLQGGQNPLTVLLQQGGQLKDMFGGAGNAAKALGGYVLGLINPFALAAAGVGALGVAYYQGSREVDAYRKAVILSGNAAGVTIGQMQSMAAQIGAVTGSQAEAAEALAAFAEGGRVGSQNLRAFAQTAVEFGRVTGQSITDVAKSFADLQGDPVKATLKLNESMNYLTEATFRQIKSLEEQGKTVEAADLAQKAYADTLNTRKDEIVRNLGDIEKAWMAIKREASFGWDAMLNIGRPTQLQDRLSSAQKALDEYVNTLPGKRTTEQTDSVMRAGGEQGLRNQIAGLKELISNQEKSADMEAKRGMAVKASTSLAQEAVKYESDLEKQRRAVMAATATYDQAIQNDMLTQAQRVQLEKDYLQVVTGITQQKEKAVKKVRVSDDPMRAQIEAYKNADKAILDSRQDLYTDLAYAVKLGTKTSVQALGEGLDKEFEVWMQRSALLHKELELLKTKKNSQKEQQVVLGKLADVQRDYDQAAKKTAGDVAVLTKEQTRAYEEANTAAQAYVDTIRRQNDRDLGGLGRGNEQREQDGRRNQRDDQYQGRKDDLLRQRQANQISPELYAEQLALEATTHAQVLAADEAYWARRKELQADWSLGASEALRNYANESANVFKQTESLMTNAFSGMEDALVKFATTGKLSFSDLARSIIADMIRIQARAAMSSVLSSLFGAWTGSATGVGNAGYGDYSSAGLKSAYGYSGGGYTGPGGKNEPAGVVHRGEVVWSQADVRKAGGVGVVEAMRLGRPGLANGGIAGPAPAFYKPNGGGGPSVVVNVTAPAGSQVEQTSRRGNAGQEIFDVVIKQAEAKFAGQLAGRYGPMHQAMLQRERG